LANAKVDLLSAYCTDTRVDPDQGRRPNLQYPMMGTVSVILGCRGEIQKPKRESSHLHYAYPEPAETVRIDDQAVDQKAGRRHRRRFDRPHGSDVCAVDGDGRPGRSPAR